MQSWNHTSRFKSHLKLSDETWNEMCYLKLLKLETFEMRCAIWNFLKLLKWDVLFETFWNPLKLLKWDVLSETFETFWNLLKLLNLETFEMRCASWNFLKPFEMRCAMWKFWKLFKLFKPIMGLGGNLKCLVIKSLICIFSALIFVFSNNWSGYW